MSRKTIAWRKLGVQCGHHGETVVPRSAKGKKYDRTCCKPMSDEKMSRFMRIVGTDGNPPKGSTKSQW